METETIKETKEAFKGVFELALFLTKRFSDGIGVDDAIAIFDKLKNDEEFKDMLIEAYKGHEKIKDEIKDLSITESVELGMLALQYVPKFIDVIKK